MDLEPVPGFGASRAVLRRRGIAATAAVAVLAAGIGAYQSVKPADTVAVTVRTGQVAAGVVDGAKVRINGLEVGTVADVSSLGNGYQGVRLALNPRLVANLTDAAEVAFSAGNLFGVSEVVITPRAGGARLADGAEFTPRRAITDNTVSNMIVTLGDVNTDAVRPHMSQVLSGVGDTSAAMLPILTALGTVADAVADIQTVPAARSFPVLAGTIRAADGTVGRIVPAADRLAGLPFMHGPDGFKIRSSLDDGLNDYRTGLLAAVQKILDPQAVDGLREVVPVLSGLLAPIPPAFANSGRLGIQLSDLMNNLRRAMPERNGVPVLAVVLSAQYPAAPGR